MAQNGVVIRGVRKLVDVPEGAGYGARATCGGDAGAGFGNRRWRRFRGAVSWNAEYVDRDLRRRQPAVKYPVIHVYSDRVRNLLTEKFRTFSGKVRTVAEVRVSQDRIEGLEDQLRLYVDAVTQVLDANRGSWGQGAFYTGGYEVTFDPVKQGGKNFLQVAKVTFEVDLS